MQYTETTSDGISRRSASGRRTVATLELNTKQIKIHGISIRNMKAKTVGQNFGRFKYLKKSLNMTHLHT